MILNFVTARLWIQILETTSLLHCPASYRVFQPHQHGVWDQLILSFVGMGWEVVWCIVGCFPASLTSAPYMPASSPFRWVVTA